MSEILSEAALDQLFRTARTFNAWLPKEVTDEQLHTIYELAKFGPTSANSSPMRVVFVKSKEAKDKLAPFLSLFTVTGEDEGLSLCRALLHHVGAGHTAIIHTASPDRVDRFARAIPAAMP